MQVFLLVFCIFGIETSVAQLSVVSSFNQNDLKNPLNASVTSKLGGASVSGSITFNGSAPEPSIESEMAGSGDAAHLAAISREEAGEGSGSEDFIYEKDGANMHAATPSSDLSHLHSGAGSGSDALVEEGSGSQIYGATPSNLVAEQSLAPEVEIPEDTSNAPEELNPDDVSEDDLVTGVAEGSTVAHWQSIKKKTTIATNGSVMTDGSATEVVDIEVIFVEPVTKPFDVEMMGTGIPEGSTVEPYMPKPPGNKTNDDVHASVEPIEQNASQSPIPAVEPQSLATEGYSREYSDGGSRWTKTTRKDMSITQSINTSSEGYKSLLHMLEDLNNRRNDSISMHTVNEFFDIRAADSIAQSPIVSTQMLNITKTREYIKTMLASASQPVRDAYDQIIDITKNPDFYYIPKRERYHTINRIITNLGPEASSEMMNLNTKVKTYCRQCNVDTPPYTMGNLVGNRLSNGAILTK